MKKRSPTLEDVRAIFRVPSLGLAEIAWRRSFALAGGAFLIFAAFQFLDTLPVTSGDLALLRTRQPALISRAALHIFRGSAPRAIAVAIVTVLFIAIAWIVVASLGRAAGIKVLLDYFRAGRNSSHARATSLTFAQGWRLGSVMGLNFFRVAISLAAFIGCVGALLLAGSVSSERNPSPGIAALVFFMAVLLITMAWSILNWFLSLGVCSPSQKGTTRSERLLLPSICFASTAGQCSPSARGLALYTSERSPSSVHWLWFPSPLLELCAREQFYLRCL